MRPWVRGLFTTGSPLKYWPLLHWPQAQARPQASDLGFFRLLPQASGLRPMPQTSELRPLSTIVRSSGASNVEKMSMTVTTMQRRTSVSPSTSTWPPGSCRPGGEGGVYGGGRGVGSLERSGGEERFRRLGVPACRCLLRAGKRASASLRRDCPQAAASHRPHSRRRGRKPA